MMFEHIFKLKWQVLHWIDLMLTASPRPARCIRSDYSIYYLSGIL